MNDYQHHPPGTQENYNSFSPRNLIVEKGNKLKCPEGPGGGKGEPGVSPRFSHQNLHLLNNYHQMVKQFLRVQLHTLMPHLWVHKHVSM